MAGQFFFKLPPWSISFLGLVPPLPFSCVPTWQWKIHHNCDDNIFSLLHSFNFWRSVFYLRHDFPRDLGRVAILPYKLADFLPWSLATLAEKYWGHGFSFPRKQKKSRENTNKKENKRTTLIKKIFSLSVICQGKHFSHDKNLTRQIFIWSHFNHGSSVQVQTRSQKHFLLV